MSVLEHLKSYCYQRQLKRAIQRAAEKHKFDFDLIAAMVWQESKGDRFARRYENGFFVRYLAGRSPAQLGGYWPPNVTIPTELHDRAYSLGVMQVMVQVARERGFVGDVSELHELDTNLEFGCLHLRWCVRHNPDKPGDIDAAVKRFNGTGAKAEQYLEKVRQHRERETWKRLFGAQG